MFTKLQLSLKNCVHQFFTKSSPDTLAVYYIHEVDEKIQDSGNRLWIISFGNLHMEGLSLTWVDSLIHYGTDTSVNLRPKKSSSNILHLLLLLLK